MDSLFKPVSRDDASSTTTARSTRISARFWAASKAGTPHWMKSSPNCLGMPKSKGKCYGARD